MMGYASGVGPVPPWLRLLGVAAAAYGLAFVGSITFSLAEFYFDLVPNSTYGYERGFLQSIWTGLQFLVGLIGFIWGGRIALGKTLSTSPAGYAVLVLKLMSTCTYAFHSLQFNDHLVAQAYVLMMSLATIAPELVIAALLIVPVRRRLGLIR